MALIRAVWYESLLHEAACWNDVELATALLASGCDVNAVGREEGWSALAAAVFMGRLEVARLLIDSGADAAAVFGEERHTMLHAAVYKNFPDMVALLLRAAIDVNATDLNGRTALDYCAYYGRTSCLEALLLDPRTDLSLYSNNSLCYAVCRGHEATTARLFFTTGKGYALIVKIFYAQILGDDGILPLNRRAILIAAQNGFPESYHSLVRAVGTAAVDAERPSWRGVKRTRHTSTDIAAV